MGKFFKMLAASSLAILTLDFASAVPVNPEEVNISSRFSTDVQVNFELYADTDDDKLVWYVPRGGSIAMLGNSNNPVPRFNATAFTEFSGVFAGQTVALLGGSFSTAGFAPLRDLLESEAQDLGMRIAPAPARLATTKFIVSGIETGNSLDVDCEFETLIITDPFTGISREVKMPKCSVTYENGNEQLVDTMQRFNSIVPAGQTSVLTSIPFQAKTTPEYALVAQNNLAVGANFDETLSAVVDWEIFTEALTKTARFTINFNQVFEKATTFAAIHNWACVDIEVSTFFQRLVRDGDIKVEYLTGNNVWSTVAPSDNDFVGAVAELEKLIRDEIFTEMRSYAQPNLPNVSREVNSFFTLRANYERQIFRVNETRIFNYNPGPQIKTARTDMFLGCLNGGFGVPVQASNTPNCRALFGIE
ncbi:hypothetical protein [Agarilytica rhodophyticola]|uniref:hypothetical protein n=1 Tax=Agarilytica rhodophyticola TaxID=1737490 RepID=UPI000CD8CA59|nr:hypothetical protein [Agarilytica rhodophyticola]